MTNIQDKIMGMSSAAREVLRCLFFHGPTWDGDIPSKAGRGELVDLGLVERMEGWQWLTREGVDFAITVMLYDREKEKWQRERSQSVHQMRHPLDGAPKGSNADEWHLFLSEHMDALPYVAVQIATAIERAAKGD